VNKKGKTNGGKNTPDENSLRKKNRWLNKQLPTNQNQIQNDN